MTRKPTPAWTYIGDMAAVICLFVAIVAVYLLAVGMGAKP